MAQFSSFIYILEEIKISTTSSGVSLAPLEHPPALLPECLKALHFTRGEGQASISPSCPHGAGGWFPQPLPSGKHTSHPPWFPNLNCPRELLSQKLPADFEQILPRRKSAHVGATDCPVLSLQTLQEQVSRFAWLTVLHKCALISVINKKNIIDLFFFYLSSIRLNTLNH